MAEWGARRDASYDLTHRSASIKLNTLNSAAMMYHILCMYFTLNMDWEVATTTESRSR